MCGLFLGLEVHLLCVGNDGDLSRYGNWPHQCAGLDVNFIDRWVDGAGCRVGFEFCKIGWGLRLVEHGRCQQMHVEGHGFIVLQVTL